MLFHTPMSEKPSLSTLSTVMAFHVHFPLIILYEVAFIFHFSLFVSLDFHLLVFREYKSLRDLPGHKFYVKFKYSIHTFVCLITHLFPCVVHSNLGQCYSYVFFLKTQQPLP